MVYDKKLIASRIKAFEAMKNSQDTSKALVTDYSYSGPKRDAKSINQGKNLFDSFPCDYESVVTPIGVQKNGIPPTFSIEEKQNHLSYFDITPITGDENKIISGTLFGNYDEHDKTRETLEIEQSLIPSSAIIHSFDTHFSTEETTTMEPSARNPSKSPPAKKPSVTNANGTSNKSRITKKPTNTSVVSNNRTTTTTTKKSTTAVKNEANNTTTTNQKMTGSDDVNDSGKNGTTSNTTDTKSKLTANKKSVNTKKLVNTNTTNAATDQVKKTIHKSQRQSANPPNTIVDDSNERYREESVKLTKDEKMAIEHRKSKATHTSDLIKEINKQHSKSAQKPNSIPIPKPNSGIITKSQTEICKAESVDTVPIENDEDPIESYDDDDDDGEVKYRVSNTFDKKTPVVTNNTTNATTSSTVKTISNGARETPGNKKSTVAPNHKPSKYTRINVKPEVVLQESLKTPLEDIVENDRKDSANDAYGQDGSTPMTQNFTHEYGDECVDTNAEEQTEPIDYNCVSSEDIFDDIVAIAANRVMLGFMSKKPANLIMLQPEIIEYNKTPLYETRLEAMESSIFCAIKSLHSKYFDERNNAADTTYESRKKLMMFILQNIGEDDTYLYWPECAKERSHKAELKLYKRPHHTEEVTEEPLKKVRKTDDRSALHNRMNIQSSITNNVYTRPTSGRGRGGSLLGNNYTSRMYPQGVDHKGFISMDNRQQQQQQQQQQQNSVIVGTYPENVLGSKRQFQESSDIGDDKYHRSDTKWRFNNDNVDPLLVQKGLIREPFNANSQQSSINNGQTFASDFNNGHGQVVRFNGVTDDTDTTFGEPRVYLSPTKVVPNSTCLFTGEPIKEGDRFTIRIARKNDYPVLSTPNSSTSKPNRDYSFALCYTSTQIGCLLQILQTIKRCTIVIRLFVEHCFHTIHTLDEKLHPRDLKTNMHLFLDYIHSNQELSDYKSCICVPQFDMAISLGHTTSTLSK